MEVDAEEIRNMVVGSPGRFRRRHRPDGGKGGSFRGTPHRNVDDMLSCDSKDGAAADVDE